MGRSKKRFVDIGRPAHRAITVGAAERARHRVSENTSISIISRLFNRMPDSECVEIRGLASNHIDGELSEEQADKVRGHLDWCKPCVAFFNTLRSTIGLLGSTQK